MIVKEKAFVLEEPKEGDPEPVPLMELFKCKLDQQGLIDNLKCRVVFRGDLHEPTPSLDPWNPHVDFTTLKVFLALCARYGMTPSQHDYVMAYL